jgi:hypothetical protein
MDKIEYRAVIKFFVEEGLTRSKIHSKFIKVYGGSSPSFSTIKKWAVGFKRGCTSLESCTLSTVRNAFQPQCCIMKGNVCVQVVLTSPQNLKTALF